MSHAAISDKEVDAVNSAPPEIVDRDEPISPVQRVDWQDFRDHLATADKAGRRKWLYPKKPSGRWYARRMYVSWLLLAILFAGPFIRIKGNPYFMFNILERKFSILGQLFWPSDFVIFVIASLLFLTSIMVFTTAFGRLWCGWTCPQTLLMEMVFRKIEYAIEGDSAKQRALATAPWTAKKIAQKSAKHFIFFALSWIIGNTLLAYIIGSEKLIAIITDDPRHHLVGPTFMTLFTLLFYAIFARFREQACTFICPYGRFMSATIDENTMVVAYDYKRGEKRGPQKRGQDIEPRRANGFGDCVDCRACVAVCPTGIDIRNGTQMECVNCTACIDACDAIMDRIGRPRGLIRFASLNSIECGQKFKFTPRMALYLTALSALATLLGILVFTRPDVETILLRAPGSLYQQLNDGRIQNLYTVKIVNKTARETPLEFKLENLPGQVRLMGSQDFKVARDNLAQTSLLIVLDPSTVKTPTTKLKIGIYANGKRVNTVTTVFIGPREK
ncbi:MAG: cytochrome c oxidase accessory protein CcoG [Verrucomicrobiales bacterium]|nr:cytochrome c oxidase accessory protein CcoG [Verrucomicrobiales bacterium]